MLILLSTYNGEKYLGDFLSSLLKQTYLRWKLLARDDNSTDRTRQILADFAEHNPNHIADIEFSDTNIGVHLSFEKLIKTALQFDDQYYMFADQDDVWLPQKIEHAFGAILMAERHHPLMAHLVCTDLVVTNENLDVITNSFRKYTGIRPDILAKRKMLVSTNYVTGCTMMMNRLALTAALPFSPDAVMHDHWTALRVIANNGKIIYLRQADILYRQHGDNTLGAVEGLRGRKYLQQHIQNIAQVNEQNKRLYRQAHAAMDMTLFGFIARKIYYFILRHIK